MALPLPPHQDEVLVLQWDRGRHAAFYVTVTSPLSPAILIEAIESIVVMEAET